MSYVTEEYCACGKKWTEESLDCVFNYHPNVKKLCPFRVIWKPQDSNTWKEFIRYETKQEAVSYLENVNPTLRPACIVFGEQTLKAYDSGIIDYELIGKIESENVELRDKIRELEIELQRKDNSVKE